MKLLQLHLACLSVCVPDICTVVSITSESERCREVSNRVFSLFFVDQKEQIIVDAYPAMLVALRADYENEIPEGYERFKTSLGQQPNDSSRGSHHLVLVGTRVDSDEILIYLDCAGVLDRNEHVHSVFLLLLVGHISDLTVDLQLDDVVLRDQITQVVTVVSYLYGAIVDQK